MKTRKEDRRKKKWPVILASSLAAFATGGLLAFTLTPRLTNQAADSPPTVESSTKPEAEATPETPIEVQPEAEAIKPVIMDFNEILDWNFGSITGNWVASDGTTIRLTASSLVYDNDQYLIENVARATGNSLSIYLSPVGSNTNLQRHVQVMLFQPGATVPQFDDNGAIVSYNPELDKSDQTKERVLLKISQPKWENGPYVTGYLLTYRA